MKTKIVEFIGRIQDGGAESLVRDYALLLDKDKFDVTILCEDYRPNSAVYKALVKNNVKIVESIGGIVCFFSGKNKKEKKNGKAKG